MPNLTFNSNNVKKVPINRNNLFYSEEDFAFETEIGKDYIEQDCNQTVILYQIDMEKTNRDSLYGETKSNEVMFKPPIELHVVYTVNQGELSSYNKTKNLGTYVKSGTLTFGVFQATLDELGVDIKNGYYIGVQVTPTHREYYVVTNDGRNNFDNKHSPFGYKPSYRSVSCAYVDTNEFNGK